MRLKLASSPHCNAALSAGQPASCRAETELSTARCEACRGADVGLSGGVCDRFTAINADY